jgi:CBS domain-containing membrane protein
MSTESARPHTLPTENTHTVDQIMTATIAYVDRRDPLSRADDLLTELRVHHIPVLDGERVVGLLSDRDLRRPPLIQEFCASNKLIRKFLESTQCGDYMNWPLITVSPETTVSQAAAIMVNKQISCLPVTQDGKLLGLVTMTDLVQLLVAVESVASSGTL